MTIQLNVRPDTRFEVAFARVIPGMEAQVFEGYFPAVGPIVGAHGGKPLGSFKILATNTTGETPEFGAMFEWPSPQAFAAFHADQRFKDIKHLRDDALDVFSNGHFFVANEVSAALDPDSEYALVIANGRPREAAPLVEMPLADDSPTKLYEGNSVTLSVWNDADDDLLRAPTDTLEIYKIQFNAPKK